MSNNLNWLDDIEEINLTKEIINMDCGNKKQQTVNFLDGIEDLDNYEKSSSDNDYVLLSLIMVTLEHPNLNGAIFSKDEVLKAKDTIVDTPLLIKPDIFDTPTEHSNSIPELDENTIIIGHHISSNIIQKDDKEHLEVTAKLYKSRYPELVSSLQELHLNGELYCSMECSYEEEDQTDNGRILKNIKFIGNCLVKEPAGQYSISLAWEAAKKDEDKLDWIQVDSVKEEHWLDGIEDLM